MSRDISEKDRKGIIAEGSYKRDNSRGPSSSCGDLGPLAVGRVSRAMGPALCVTRCVMIEKVGKSNVYLASRYLLDIILVRYHSGVHEIKRM